MLSCWPPRAEPRPFGCPFSKRSGSGLGHWPPKLGVVQPLLRLIRRCMSYEVMTSAACAVLWNLAACSENQSRLVDEGCLAVLREAVVPPFEHFETIGNALHTLIWLSVCRENQVAIALY